jgi:uncharacterized protein YndB with AHSA1/START domain
MKVVKWIAIVLGTLAVLFFGIGFMLPSKFNVSRAIEIKAPPERVFMLITDPREWKRWTVWNQRDPGMKITYSGPPAGPGAKWAWESKTEGTGNMEFTRAEANKRLEYRLSFPDFGMVSTGALTLLPSAGGGTELTWATVGDVGANPIKHYFAAFMDRMVGPDFEGGLRNLKALAEKP